MDFRMEYDPVAEERKLVGLGLNGTVRSRLVEASAGWNRQNYGGGDQLRSNHYIQQTTTLRLAGNQIGGTVQFNYDIGRSTMLNQRYIANYNAQCCGIAIEYPVVQLPGAGPTVSVPQDRRINFAFTLAGIGSFSNFFGTFGEELLNRCGVRMVRRCDGADGCGWACRRSAPSETIASEGG